MKIYKKAEDDLTPEEFEKLFNPPPSPSQMAFLQKKDSVANDIMAAIDPIVKKHYGISISECGTNAKDSILTQIKELGHHIYIWTSGIMEK